MIRSLNGKTPKIAESAFISEAAYIAGDVEIGENSSAWPGAVIRTEHGSIRIGQNTHIEDNCVVHGGGNASIGDNVIVGHGAMVHCHRIGNNVLIGINATVLDGADVGNFCVLAAGCVVTPGMKIPDNSLVSGVPGKIQGQVPEEQRLRWLEEAPKIYARFAREYKEQGL